MYTTRYAAICLWSALIVLTAVIFATFIMKNRVQNLEKELALINSQINEDIQTIHILNAEWSHLNNPDRLRKLAAEHSNLKPLKAQQIINYASIPFNYENNRKMIARHNLNTLASRNKEMKHLAKAQH